MEKPKPTQNHEQERPKTLEDYAVKTFPADLDVTIRPLTVIRSGKDGGGIRDDEGWTPGDMLCVCKEGTGSIELFVKVHKLIKVYGEHVYEECVPITKIVSLKKLQSREANKGFNESYIQELYGKSTEEMIEEGERAAEQISNSSVVEEGGSDLERSKVSLKIGSTAIKATGIKKPVETDKTSADLVDLPAAKTVENPVVEKSMEMNEVNTDILPEDFKVAIDSFKQLTEDNNDQFFEKAKNITGELNQLRGLIKDNPTAMNNPAVSEMITSTSGRIRDLEASRSESVNKFKNNMNSLLEGLKSEIENEDEKRRRLVKLTEHVDQMGVDDTVLGEVTNGLLDKFTAIRRIIDSSQNDRWGMDGYVDRMISVINGIISDLSTVSGRRRGIVGGIEGIKSEGYYQKR